jgi:hypothetical protein
MYRLYIYEKVKEKYSYQAPIVKEDINDLLTVLDNYILQPSDINNKYMIIEQTDCDFPVFLNTGNEEEYINFKNKYIGGAITLRK